MNWEIIGMIATSVCGFVGVILANNAKIAVLESKIDSLTKEIRKYDNIHERITAVETKVKNLENEVFKR